MNLGKEDERTEFKESLSQLDKGIRSLTAMVNRHNEGTVYFGVDDDGEVIGLIVGKDTLSNIREKIKSYVEPMLITTIRENVSDDGKSYISIHSESKDIPYLFDGRIYVRNVSSDDRASVAIARKMLMSGNSDVLCGTRSANQDLTFNTLFMYLNRNGKHTSDDLTYYRNNNLLNQDGEFNNMAYILSDQNDVCMQIATFEGTDKSVMRDRSDYGHCCLISSIITIMDKVRSMNSTRVDLSTGIRQNTDLFDMDAFREAWINACVHNDWRNMQPPSVLVFDDRIEVTSYGGIPMTLSRDEFYQGKSQPVNGNLFRIFMAVNLSESTGFGVPRIVQSYGRESINVGDFMVTVTIPFRFRPDWAHPSERTVIMLSQLNDNQRRVLEVISKNPNVKLEDVSKEVGMSLSGVKKVVSRLKELGLLRNAGKTRNTRWML